MKLKDLKELIKDSDRNALEKLLIETYKQLKPSQKEDFDILIPSILSGAGTVKPEKQKTTPENFDTLAGEIEYFLENAYAGNYFSPNRVIPKNLRPKWRFLVKDYIKALSVVTPEHPDYHRAVQLLCKLYSMLCYACCYYLFSTTDAFRSVGMKQEDLFELVIKKVLAEEYSRENISLLAKLSSTGGLSSDSLYICQQFILVSALQTTDSKYIAIEEIKKLVSEAETRLVTYKSKLDSLTEYGITESIDNYCKLFLILAISLSEPDSAISYFFSHARERNKEVVLYCILNIIDTMNEDALWISTYELGLKKKIKPRECLTKEYNRRKREQNKK